MGQADSESLPVTPWNEQFSIGLAFCIGSEQQHIVESQYYLLSDLARSCQTWAFRDTKSRSKHWVIVSSRLLLVGEKGNCWAQLIAVSSRTRGALALLLMAQNKPVISSILSRAGEQSTLSYMCAIKSHLFSQQTFTEHWLEPRSTDINNKNHVHVLQEFAT